MTVLLLESDDLLQSRPSLRDELDPVRTMLQNVVAENKGLYVTF